MVQTRIHGCGLTHGQNLFCVSKTIMPPTKRQPNNMDADLKRLIKELGHKKVECPDRARKEIAARLSADPQTLDVLLPVMERELLRVRHIMYLVWLGLAAYMFFSLVDVVHGRWERVLRDFSQLFMFCFALSAPLSKSLRLKNLLGIVSDLDDKRLIGPLLQAQHYHEVRSSVQTALVHLLPQLQHSDTLALNEIQRTLLYQSLLNSENPEYVIAALKALEQVGDGRALPYAQKLASPADKRRKQNAAVTQAAQECLGLLQQRIAQQQISQSLLRPSDRTASAPDTLLRPASITQDTEPAQLLRAGTNAQES